MVQAVRMPMLGNTMETGILVEWRVEEGEEVEDGDVLVVVESEKASADVTANQTGRLTRVDVEEEAEVPPGTVMGVVLGPDEDLSDAPEPMNRTDPEGTESTGEQEAEPSGPSAAASESAAGGESARGEETTSEGDDSIEAAPGARKLASERDMALSDIEGTGPDGAVLRADVEEHLEASASPSESAESAETEASPDIRFASPSTRRLAREHGVPLADLEGTGIGGRITESDVRRAVGTTGAPDPGTVSRDGAAPDRRSESRTSDADALGVTITEERPLTGARRTIASRMSQSTREAPHVTLNRKVRVDRAEETAEVLADTGTVAIGFTDLLVAAAVRALETHPEFNAWFEDEHLRLVDGVNVAVAVDAQQGLLTPVIRKADQLSLERIAGERRRLTDTVLANEHAMDDLQGGTFTITNLGMFGVDDFDPIINPPQIAILGVGRIEETGDRRTCTLSLSFDHRAVDGADAARFLSVLADGIETPSVVVGDRAQAGAAKAADTSPTHPNRSQRQSGERKRKSITKALQQNLAGRAAEIAEFHDWSTPTFDVHLSDGRPTVVVKGPDDVSPATLKRLTYAACRDSEYAGVVVGFRDPVIELG